MAKHTSYYELQEALAQPGCALCRLVEKTVARYLEGLVYENANDYKVRAEIGQARGFCNLHAWQLRDCHGSALDIAILSGDVLAEWLRQLQTPRPVPTPPAWLDRVRAALGLAPRAAGVQSLAAALGPQRPCPACQARESAVQAYAHELLTHLTDPELTTRYVEAGGLCLPHFRQVVQLATSQQVGMLAKLQTQALTPLLEHVREFIRKHDYRFELELTPAEGEAWLQALALISGRRGTG